VRYWQEKSGVSPLATALIGFSQGAIMSLESIKAAPDLASRVIAFNGRYATWAVSAEEALQQAGGDVTLDIVDDLGHAIDDRSMQLAIERLRYTVPKHYFD
ncbi:esterase, partial [Escherichia coli]|nr:esterase [Escherichia coli]